jgi:type I restriction enzyme S subunit
LSIYKQIQNNELLEHIERVGKVFFDRKPASTPKPKNTNHLSEWREVKLGDICTDISYGYTASGNNEPVGPKFLRITDIVPQRINWETVPYCSIDEKIISKYKLEKGDIVIARTGATTGYNYMFKDNVDAIFASYLIRYRINPSIAYPLFINYVLKSYEWTGFVENIISGSAQPGANAKMFADFELTLPPLPEQQAIAEVLSSLDDKIDLLHRQNKTLEQLAETLFRQWFVEEAEESWEEMSLYDSIELIGGGTPKTTVNEYWDGNIKWLSGGDIAANHKSFVVSSEKSITELGLKNSSAKLLPKFSTVISARGTVGKYCMLSEPMAFSQSNYGILPKFKDCFFFTYLLVAHSVDELQSAAYGSVFDTITTNTFKGLTIALPEEEYIIRFNESMEPYFSKILTNQNQIRTLTALRDTLLPKLMSGEIRLNYDF